MLQQHRSAWLSLVISGSRSLFMTSRSYYFIFVSKKSCSVPQIDMILLCSCQSSVVISHSQPQLCNHSCILCCLLHVCSQATSTSLCFFSNAYALDMQSITISLAPSTRVNSLKLKLFSLSLYQKSTFTSLVKF